VRTSGHQIISGTFTGDSENDLDDQLKSKVSRVRQPDTALRGFFGTQIENPSPDDPPQSVEEKPDNCQIGDVNPFE